MSVWIEIHCDVKSAVPPNVEVHKPFCFSHNGDIPGAMVGNTVTAVSRGLNDLAWEASRKQGWKRVLKDGEYIWACPNCKTTL